MKNTKIRHLRTLVQASIFLSLVIVIAVYNLYTSEMLNFKILSISDLNPYGGWNAIRQLAEDSGYICEGISKSIALSIALVVMAILGGRFFCGWLCPLGAVQDYAAWFGKKVKAPRCKSQNKKSFNPSLFKYLVLLSVLLISIFGYGAAVADFSPWRALLSLPKAIFARDEAKLDIMILAGIFLASMFLSRFFCRYLCPLGAAQALLSSISPLCPKHDKGCGSCNGCLDECPAGIRLSSESDIISPECIRCMNCMGNCKTGKNNGIRLKIGNKSIPVKAYVTLMLVLFMVIWLGAPQLWGAGSSGGNISAGILKDGTYQGEAKGFAGKIITEITVAKGRITDINVIEHQESKGWYEEVFMTLSKEMIEKQKTDVDGISGATRTSKGFIKSVENAVKKAQ